MKQNDILPDEKECKEILGNQEQLTFQSFNTLKNISDISPLTKEIMSRQSTINIGIIGNVGQGKTSLVHTISGNQISKNKSEKEKFNKKSCYVNAKLYKCPKCPEPECYQSFNSEKEDDAKCTICKSILELLRHICFLDCPSYDILMSSMLNVSSVMDGALLLLAADEPCPNPQSKDNFISPERMSLKNIIIIQNKIDNVMKDDRAKNQYEQIKNFVQNSDASNSPIIPVSAKLKYNVDVVIKYLSSLPLPKRDFISSPLFNILNSFDIHNLGEETIELKRGIVYGTLSKGILKVGEAIEIKPGIFMKDINGETKIIPIYTRIVSLQAEKNNLIYAIPGGLISIGLKIDPLISRNNNLSRKILGFPGKLPDIFSKVLVKCHFRRRYLNIQKNATKKNIEHIKEIKKQEILLLNISTVSVGGIVNKIDGSNNDEILFSLRNPICVEISEKMTISRKIGPFWRLIGWGEVLSGGEPIST